MTWRWPYVSRDALEIQQTFSEHLLNMLADEKRRSEHLLDTVLQLRMSGATIARVSPLPAGVVLPRPRRSQFEQALDENPRASNDPFLRRYLSAWATKEMQKEGADEGKIADQLRTSAAWPSGDGDDDDDAVLGV